jgi:ArsR family transcriptional regulator
VRLVEIFKSLGEKNRIRIVNILLESRVCVCEIQDVLGITQVNASKHLAKLRDSNIVKTDKEAQRVFYSLSSEISENEELVSVIKSYRDGELFKKDLTKLKEIQTLALDYVCPKD